MHVRHDQAGVNALLQFAIRAFQDQDSDRGYGFPTVFAMQALGVPPEVGCLAVIVQVDDVVGQATSAPPDTPGIRSSASRPRW